jgi:YVTN family beta-propeller protein
VTQYCSDSIVALDPVEERVVWRTPVGHCAASIAVSPDAGRVYVSNRHSHEVSVVDAVGGAVVATVSRRHPGGIAVLPR